MKQPKVLIVGYGNYDYIRLMHSLGFVGTRSLLEADLVVFTGGHDVSPELYGEPTIPGTSCSPQRDANETEIFDLCREFKVPMLGICRGAQFLTVMSGGSLWQDVDGHANGPHDMVVKATGDVIKVTSTHHQMMHPYNNENELMGEVLAYAQLSTLRKCGEWVDPDNPKQGMRIVRDTGGGREDPEVVWYGQTDCLCFQPHPEFGNATPELRKYLFDCLMEKIGKSRNWFVDDEQKKEPVQSAIAKVNWQMFKFAVKNNLSSMRDETTGRQVFLSSTTALPVAYADLTTNNEDEDPLDILLKDDEMPW